MFGLFSIPEKESKARMATMKDLPHLSAQIEGLAGIIAAGKNCVLGAAPGINLWRAYPVRNIQCSWCREVRLYKGPARQLDASWKSAPGRQLIPLARFSNKFQMKSVRLRSNVIFADSHTRSIPIHCASSWITLLPGARSTAFSPAHRRLAGCRHRGSQPRAWIPESPVEVGHGELQVVP